MVVCVQESGHLFLGWWLHRGGGFLGGLCCVGLVKREKNGEGFYCV